MLRFARQWLPLTRCLGQALHVAMAQNLRLANQRPNLSRCSSATHHTFPFSWAPSSASCRHMARVHHSVSCLTYKDPHQSRKSPPLELTVHHREELQYLLQSKFDAHAVCSNPPTTTNISSSSQSAHSVQIMVT